MSHVASIRPYVPTSYPAIQGGEARWLQQEFSKIARSIVQLKEAMEEIEERVEALEAFHP
jgi:chaperonin cofactor prefoldin